MSKKRRAGAEARGEKVDRRARSCTARDTRFRCVVEVSNDGLAFDKACISYADRENGLGFYDEITDRLQGADLFQASETWLHLRAPFAATKTEEIASWVRTLFVVPAHDAAPVPTPPDVAARAFVASMPARREETLVTSPAAEPGAPARAGFLRGTGLALERWQRAPGSVATAVVVRQVRGGES